MEGALPQNGARNTLFIGADNLDEFLRTAQSAWEIWRNHTSTRMMVLDFKIARQRWAGKYDRLALLFHIFCTSNVRSVSASQSKGAGGEAKEFSCAPLSLICESEGEAVPQMRTPSEVLRERLGKHDEISIAFIQAASELDIGDSFALLELESGASSRAAVLATSGNTDYFIDLVDGAMLESQVDFSPGNVEKMGASSPGEASLLFEKICRLATLGIVKCAPPTPLSRFYAHKKDSPAWRVRSVYSTPAAILFFWHVQMVRRLARPEVGADILALASSDKYAVSAVAASKRDLFAQIAAHATIAISAYSSMPPDEIAVHAIVRGRLANLLDAIQNTRKK